MRRRILLALLPVLAIAGLALCVYLALDHLTVYEGGVSEGLFCGSGSHWNCDDVASHPSSWLLGLPLAFWGVAYFVFVTGLSIAANLYRGDDKKSVLAFGALVCGLAFAFDLYLGFVMLTEIGTLCPGCIATYAVNMALCAGFWSAERSAPGELRWSRLLPHWKSLARGSDADYYRNLLKAGLAVLTAVIAWRFLLEFRIPLEDIRQFGERQVSVFLEEVRTAAPIDAQRLAGEPTDGPSDAAVDLVLMGDFQCGLCRRLAGVIDDLRNEWPGRIRVGFVNSPLNADCNPAIETRFHEDACWLAEAGECAHEQGRFWAYHGFLYGLVALSKSTRTTVLERFDEIGLEREPFLACMDSHRASVAVAADVNLCHAIDATTTPSMVINGHLKRGTMFPWMLRKIVVELIERSASAPETRG